ncbi:hypothetical protein BUALT_Bualt09G0039600 [Buddleja alternifolia]|uniref:Transposase MuDR plant domain-containing protein n=1 Tax=Buddleja alternifolia TaxID=168488 RepID=A0AAV6X6H1_9LAMI|nr:hypothetical protein BUALT_Bualt09G0039600 [Buddleja alternifolia]
MVKNRAIEDINEEEEEDGEDLESNSSDFDSGKDSDNEHGERIPVFSEQDMCAEVGCKWKIAALVVGKDASFQVGEYNPKHSCGRAYYVRNCKSAWIGKKYQDRFRTYLRRNVVGFRQDVIQDIRVHVSRNQAYTTKWQALKQREGNTEEKYGKLWDYAEKLRT